MDVIERCFQTQLSLRRALHMGIRGHDIVVELPNINHRHYYQYWIEQFFGELGRPLPEVHYITPLTAQSFMDNKGEEVGLAGVVHGAL